MSNIFRGSVLTVTDDMNRRAEVDISLTWAGIPARFVLGAGLAQAVRSSHPVLILIDYSRCGERGFQALSDLKQNPETSAIPILAYGPGSDTDGRDRAQSAGADAVLAEGRIASDLLAVVREWTGDRPTVGTT